MREPQNVPTGDGGSDDRSDVGEPSSAEGMPAHIARLWRLSSASRLGRRAVLDVEQVVGSAVALADRDGLAGVTLPKVAGELGVTPMSLYRYVGSKEQLLLLMGDYGSRTTDGGDAPEASGPWTDAHAADPAWRRDLRRWASDVRAMYQRHPWLAQLPVQGPPAGPHELERLDSGLATLRGTGLGWGAKVGIVTLVSGYVRSASQQAADMSAARAGTGREQAEVEEEYGRAMARLVSPDRFPEAAALFGSGLFEQEPPADVPAEVPDHDFRFGLETLLDGVAAAVERTT